MLRQVEAVHLESLKHKEKLEAIRRWEKDFMPLQTQENVHTFDLAKERMRDRVSHFTLVLAG